MKKIIGKIDSLFLGVVGEELIKKSVKQLEFHLDGIIGDRHAGFERVTWEGDDKQAAGTKRRNERQWSAISKEELNSISEEMALKNSLVGGDIGVNFCVKGVASFSKLPKGTILRFKSGLELLIEEYNPPCMGMSKNLAKLYQTIDGKRLDDNKFIEVSKYTRGVVGIVEVPGIMIQGDEVEILPYAEPKWIKNQ